ncbi:MAG: hypothetical protein ACM31L_02670 [Actinomycetota bacterium]
MSAFTIDAAHIRRLADDQLRALVVQLCQAELLRFGLPLSALVAGGHQDTADGGIDVRVEGEASLDFIKRPSTTFQVKVPDLKPAGITKEMRPDGVPRAAIAELAACGGAYVIVSATASLTDPVRSGRLRAMREAAGTVAIVVDFYDGERLALWVNRYPGAALWVRDRIGLPLLNWQPWRNWSFPREAEVEPFLVDDKARIVDGRHRDDGDLPTVAGIQRIRAVLARPGGVVRLVGLSGTGKTRLAQALFEPEVGSQVLDRATAVYADLGQGPEPSPVTMIARLAAMDLRAVVIVDNCPPDAHKVLADLVGRGGPVSLLTIEYDVRDDTPEGSEVFRLDTASAEVIERLLARRVPHLSDEDRRRIVTLSDCNSRLALAMADAAPRRGGLDRLDDAELFDRLFRQRNAPDTELQCAAQVCALLYSFDVEGEGEGSELIILAGLAEVSRRRLHQHVATLLRRQLAQKRGRWRAILPHVLANHLARTALADLPAGDVLAALSRPRLLKSFARRLGYLDDCDEARTIVAGWLAPGGRLGELNPADTEGWDLLQSVAPVAPELALAAIERAMAGPSAAAVLAPTFWRRNVAIRLLWAIAWDASHFRRCALALAHLVGAEPERNNVNSALPTFQCLFQIRWSGTHASPEARLVISGTCWIAIPGSDCSPWTGCSALGFRRRLGPQTSAAALVTWAGPPRRMKTSILGSPPSSP